MFKTISPKLYQKYKDQVLDQSNARQRYEASANLRGLTDKEIAEKLGLSEDEVTEIRILAELETPPLKMTSSGSRIVAISPMTMLR